MENRRISWRPLVLPAEHGGWGFLLEPIALGLIVAPSSGGVLIAAGAVAAFLARHPAKLAVQDGVRCRWYPRTHACVLLAAAYSAVAAAFLVVAPWNAVAALAAAIPFAAAQFHYDVRNHGRSLSSEVLGVIAPGAIAAAIGIAAGRPIGFAATLWLLVVLRAVPSVLYVRSALRGSSRAVMIGAHALAVGIAATVAPIAAVAMIALLVRAIPSPNGVPARMIGMRELAWGAVAVGVIAVAVIG